ncbi:hypothetical protein T03_10632 [Trichinella britovi]|uniref:Uncharacterized protein n=1 Tax=Trichinella britovi TaxID=45882 RepID=A0A0V1D3F1_TRIBR|nr:hypothetical protein T03_10632 [Trichinella britovi]
MDYIINLELVHTRVRLSWLNGVTQYWSRNLAAFGAYFCRVLSLSYALGYASGNFLKISNFLKYSPRLYPQATPEGK